MSRRRDVITTELGEEARCAKCRDFWPADGEFFHTIRGKPHSWCKACYVEDQVAKGKRPGYGRLHMHHDEARAAA